MSLSQEEVRRIAILARIAVSDDEIPSVQEKLNGILGMIAEMQSAHQRDFAGFERELPALVWSDDAQIRCYSVLARYLAQARAESVAREARALLANTRESATEGCAVRVLVRVPTTSC